MNEVVGKLIKKLPLESGAKKDGGTWTKLTFVLQKKDTKFPQQIAIETFNGELIQFITDTSLDTLLCVYIDVSSREYNGKYYSQISGWKAEVVKEEESMADHKGVAQMAQMHNKQYQGAKDVSWKEPTEDNGSDLPF